MNDDVLHLHRLVMTGDMPSTELLALFSDKSRTSILRDIVLQTWTAYEWKTMIAYYALPDIQHGQTEHALFDQFRAFKRTVLEHAIRNDRYRGFLQSIYEDTECVQILRLEALYDCMPVQHRRSIYSSIYRSYKDVQRDILRYDAFVPDQQMPNIGAVAGWFHYDAIPGGFFALCNVFTMLQHKRKWSNVEEHIWTTNTAWNVVRCMYAEHNQTYLRENGRIKSRYDAFLDRLETTIQWCIRSGMPVEYIAHGWIDFFQTSRTHVSDRGHLEHIDMIRDRWNTIFSTFSSNAQARIADYVSLFLPDRVKSISPFMDYDALMEHTTERADIMDTLQSVPNDERSTNIRQWGLKMGHVQALWHHVYPFAEKPLVSPLDIHFVME